MRSKLSNFEHVGGGGRGGAAAGPVQEGEPPSSPEQNDRHSWKHHLPVISLTCGNELVVSSNYCALVPDNRLRRSKSFHVYFLLLQVWDPWWVGWRHPWSERVCTVEYSSLRTKQCGISSWPTMTQTMRVPRQATLNSGTIGSFFHSCIYTCKTLGSNDWKTYFVGFSVIIHENLRFTATHESCQNNTTAERKNGLAKSRNGVQCALRVGTKGGLWKEGP